MSYIIEIMIPAYAYNQILNCSSALSKKQKQKGDFRLNEEDLNFLISQVQSVAPNAIKIRDSGTRVVNNEAGLDWFPVWNRVSEVEGFGEQSYYDILKSINSNSYSRSFFGNDGEDYGKLMHEFKDIPPHKGATQNGKNSFYIKFITPDSVLDPNDIYEEYESYDGAFEKAGVPEEDVFNNNSSIWDFVSFHIDKDTLAPKTQEDEDYWCLRQIFTNNKQVGNRSLLLKIQADVALGTALKQLFADCSLDIRNNADVTKLRNTVMNKKTRQAVVDSF